ncbi:unnamed protein product [Rotaria magnacalcarata]|uniref:PAT complex subunit CCDC47 n=6 Tax=Rotaria magnacalcarata TaxID=392030 RepID=A0A814JA28_9BILA|nr:unnamed protein product [Rotaria magnacalcarata]CAF1663168.1 unnamed protein product [Rotaria magnacalcarata]CAF1900462.1 unnamed protein product [Rotaria magnacalcarata]CAF2101819.1 unnamed protein product [Rotaria magnacalcarata]CAF2103203.1 unnamed protein product [Rotaria magnacalcarata]
MRSSITVFFILLHLLLCFVWSAAKKIHDEDFSEFDDFDEDEFVTEAPFPSGASQLPSKTQSNQPDQTKSEALSQPSMSKTTEQTTHDGVTIDDDDDLMFDEEEFEATDLFSSSSTPDFKIAEVPANLTGNRWESYHCEAIMILVLLSYLINFLIGRSKNARLAATIYNSQRDLLERKFSLVGDNGQTQTTKSTDEQTDNDVVSNNMHKESESLYVLWCSGRTLLDSMLIEIRFIKRQCLFNSLAALIKSINDMIIYTIDYSKDDMETFVFCLAKKRSAVKLHRDMNDLSQFCSERKNAEKHSLSGNYQILSEIGEISNVIIDSRVGDFINKFPDALEYIHISDQYTGMKIQNDNQQSSSSQPSNNGTTVGANGVSATQQQDALNLSERSVRRVLIVAFNLIPSNDRSLQITAETVINDYSRFVLNLADRVSLYRFASKELKAKTSKNRQRIEEQFLKNVNQQRQEQAQQRREEKRRAEKEKIMQSDDPDKQRKWEEKEHKREMKRRQPKMKQMKIKSM